MAEPASAGPSKPVAPVARAVATVSSLLPSSSTTTAKRADLIALKQRLASILSVRPDLGPAYWSGLTSFLVGKTTRGEFGDVLARSLERLASDCDRRELVSVHNAFVLSIVYNTTRAQAASVSVRHEGFSTRGTQHRVALSRLVGGTTTPANGGDGDDETELQARKRRKIKDVVLRVGKRERAEIKANANAIGLGSGSGGGGTVDDRRRMGGESIGDALRASRGGQGQVGDGGVPKGYQDTLDDKGLSMPANFTQEYNRLVQAPLCCEARGLPDADTLRDRMMLIAYEEGMVDGVEGAAVANLLSNAVDYYVKQIISSAASLVRGPASRPEPALARRPLPPASPSTSTFAPAGVATSHAVPPLPETHSPGTPPPQPSTPRRTRSRPLSISDFHALFAVQPALLGPNGSTHTSAVERMYALPPQSDSEDESDDEYESSRRQEVAAAAAVGTDASGDTKMSPSRVDPDAPAPPPAAAASLASGVVGSGKMPRLSTASRNRNLSFYGAARPIPPSPPSPPHASTAAAVSSSSAASGKPNPALGGSSSHSTTTSSHRGAPPARTQFLLDPTSLHGVPEGHPDVPHVASTTALVAAPSSSSLLGEPSQHTGVASTAATASTPVAAAAAAGGNPSQSTPTLSPKSLSLRNSLFPELANTNPAGSSSTASGGGGGGGGPSSTTRTKHAKRRHGDDDDDDDDAEDGPGHRNGNGTTTDEAESEFDDLTDRLARDSSSKAAAAMLGAGSSSASASASAAKSGSAAGSSGAAGPGGGGLKIKLGGTTTGTVTPNPGNAGAGSGGGGGGATTPGGGGGGPRSATAADKDKELGRKLWEVVDSVRLLDGVLDP
ncbi:hypothetical protein JCM11491_002840 [Sporobolomyces phaffii]